MEVVEVPSHGSGTQDSIAVRSDNRSYSYNQLISSARSISGLLCNGDLNVSLQIHVYRDIFLKCLSIGFLQYLDIFFEYRLPKQNLMVHKDLGILEGLE